MTFAARSTQAHREICAPLRMVSGSVRIPVDLQEYMITPSDQFDFNFYDPTDILVRLLLFSPLAGDERNLCFHPVDSQYYDDFCDGSRMQRVESALPKGTSALGCVLFFDEINRDEKGSQTKHNLCTSYVRVRLDVKKIQIHPLYYTLSINYERWTTKNDITCSQK